MHATQPGRNQLERRYGTSPAAAVPDSSPPGAAHRYPPSRPSTDLRFVCPNVGPSGTPPHLGGSNVRPTLRDACFPVVGHLTSYGGTISDAGTVFSRFHCGS